MNGFYKLCNTCHKTDIDTALHKKSIATFGSYYPPFTILYADTVRL